MKVKDIMTKNPCCCTEDASLQDAARMMIEYDCGELPVVDDDDEVIGVITDRDICIRAVAEGKDPKRTPVAECMTTSVATVTPEMSIEECCNVMEDNRVRRVPVVDSDGRCSGIVSQADIAARASEHLTAEMLREVSRVDLAEAVL